MRTYTTMLLVLAIGAAGAMAQSKKKASEKAIKGGPFVPGCTLPFDTIKQSGLTIDTSCLISGDADPATPEGLQNLAKNNFCAKGPVATVTPAILGKLQTAAANGGITFGGEAEVPVSRAALRKGFAVDGKTYKEGQLVREVVFIVETHPADTSSGENVNCKNKGNADNDVHMAVGTAYGVNECTSVTAEISPHFRPAEWKAVFDVAAKAKAGKSGPAEITKFPLRIEGQLFFDASHHPCNGLTPDGSNPKRVSLWEIHPVYKIDVCSKTTVAACKVDDESLWTPLEKWKAE